MKVFSSVISGIALASLAAASPQATITPQVRPDRCIEFHDGNANSDVSRSPSTVSQTTKARGRPSPLTVPAIPYSRTLQCPGSIKIRLL
jgi:hypothetical protein